MDMGIRTEDFSSDYIKYNDGWNIDQEMIGEDIQGSIDLLYGPFVNLPKGHYTLTIEYDCDHGQAIRPYAAEDNNSYIVTDHLNLDKNLNVMSFNFRTKAPIDNFEIRTFYDGEGYFSIKNIELYRNMNGYKEIFFILFIIFVVGDVCILNKSFLIIHKKEVLLLIGIIIITGMQVFIKGIDYPLEDIDFHLMRIEGLSSEIRLGHLPVRLQSSWSGVSGYPVSIYYGDILLYFPAILRLIGFSVSFSYAAYLTFINVLTVVISFFSFKSIIRNTDIALLMTLGYTGCAYRYATVLENGLLGEYTAASFVPMLAAALYAIYTEEERKHQPNMLQAIVLAVGMSGIILSHTIAAVISTFAICTFCIINIRRTLRVRTLLTFLTAVITTALLALFFIVPFLDYYFNMDVLINSLGESIPHIQGTGLNVYGLFAFFQDPYKTGCRATPGLLLMLSLIMSMIFWIEVGVSKEIKIATVFSALWLWLSTNVFPWDWLSYNLPIGGVLAKIQMLERCEVYACIGLTVLMGLLLRWVIETERLKTKNQYHFLYVSVAAIGLIGVFVFFGHYAEHKNVYYVLDGSEIPHDTKSGAEYMRIDKEGEPIDYVRKNLEVMNADIEVLSQSGWTMDMNVITGNSPGVIKTPYTNYKGYVACDTMGNEFEIFDDEYCKVAFAVPANYNGQIRVTYSEPWYWRLSEIISLVTWIGLIIYVAALYKKKHN